LRTASRESSGGPAVGAAIDGSDWWDVLLGTSAGPDTVLLVTENRSLRDQVMHRLRFFHDRYGAAGEIERRPFHE
jgi:arginine repressor-like DNA binding protein